MSIFSVNLNIKYVLMPDNTNNGGMQSGQGETSGGQTTSQPIQEFVFVDTSIQMTLNKGGVSAPINTKDLPTE
jgi:hypothetical protein